MLGRYAALMNEQKRSCLCEICEADQKAIFYDAG